MRKLSIVIAIAYAASIVGCATGVTPTDKAEPVPSKHVFNIQLLQQTPGTGQVIVKLDNRIGCATQLSVNGKRVADINSSEKFVMYLPEGDHILSAWPGSFCGGGMSEIKVSVKADSHQTFRVGYGSGSDYHILPTAF